VFLWFVACVCCRFWRVLSSGVEDADSDAMHGKEEDEERHVYSKRKIRQQITTATETRAPYAARK
jgi:hypothetical protein